MKINLTGISTNDQIELIKGYVIRRAKHADSNNRIYLDHLLEKFKDDKCRNGIAKKKRFMFLFDKALGKLPDDIRLKFNLPKALILPPPPRGTQKRRSNNGKKYSRK